jgi:fumarylacetoacetase
MMLESNDPTRKTWVAVPEGCDFPIQNLPFGIFKTADNPKPRIGIALGEMIIDVYVMAESGLLGHRGFDLEILNDTTLNRFASLGRVATRSLRERIANLFDIHCLDVQDNAVLRKLALVPQSQATMCLPFFTQDYTDFYSSIEHATNVGIMFRGKENALMPNWKHIPIGYHGRASSIVVSGTDIRRPKGQMLPPDATVPVFGPSKLLDFELEMAFVVGAGNEMGTSISVEQAEDHIFGMMLFNDWSARDIQAWEYVPLGPFLGKNFASSLSPWVVTMDALEPYRVVGPEQDPEPLPYLRNNGAANFDIALEVLLQPEGGSPETISRSNYKYMYWNMRQQLAHHTINGCNMQTGDICASGTISGPTPDSYGSMLELTWRGANPIALHDGNQRKFIQDGDTIIMRGHCEKDGLRIGFGEVTGKVLPAN